MRKQTSPIKVKDYFTNPIHKIKQAAFHQIGFNQSHLNTFVKAFTNRNNNRFISFEAIRAFIKSFTNNSPKLIQTYEDFFRKRFEMNSEGDISLETFLEFFGKEEKHRLDELDHKGMINLFQDLDQLNEENIMAKSHRLGVKMSRSEAAKIISMINRNANIHGSHKIQQEAFLKAINKK